MTALRAIRYLLENYKLNLEHTDDVHYRTKNYIINKIDQIVSIIDAEEMKIKFTPKEIQNVQDSETQLSIRFPRDGSGCET